MSYYGRTVGRAKGVGKMVNWNQGGGPMKAGLGPQINVSTWARRVIARRTNSCCCDPIELTSVQMSLPRMTAGPSSGGNNAQVSEDLPWNQWMPGSDTDAHTGGGYVGPPRNDISGGGVILSTNQIYVIFTFNKPISPSYSIYKYNPSLPTGTSLELIGLKKVDQSVGNSPLGAPVKVTTINPPGVDYYIREAKLASVTQIPGGTEVLTFDETNKRLTTGSRFLIDSEIVTGVGIKAKSNLNTINAKIFPAMQSGLNHAEVVGYLPTNYWDRGPPQDKISSYGAFNRRLDYETRGGFAPENPRNPVVPGAGGTGGGPAVDFWEFEKTNHFLGNIFGVYTKTTKRASDQYDMSGSSTASNLNIEPNLSTLNIRLVQSNPATGVPISTRVENYSADAAYISTGPVKWLDYQHALFINITSIMQIMLKNPTANAVPEASGNTIPAGQGWDGSTYPTTVPVGVGPGAFGPNGAPPMPKYYAGNPLQMITATEMSAGPAIAPQVIRPTLAQPLNSLVPTDWRNSNFNNAGKYATFVSDLGLQATPQAVQKSGPWSIGAINGNIAFLPGEEKLPSWTDATWNQIGYVRRIQTPVGAAGEMLCYNAVTIDSGGKYGTGAPAPGFETYTFNRSGNLENTIKYSSYHILYYGHVIEKMRQLTYNGFGSYLIRDILSSKYDCGNNGFDGPIGDIIIPSGDKTITTTDNTTEAGLLTFDF